MKTLTYMQLAYLVSQESKCCSWKVGAVIEKNGHILGMGYNGTASGHDHCRDVAKTEGWVNTNGEFIDAAMRSRHSAWSLKNEIHAEVNAMLFAARHGTTGLQGATMYVTLSPCVNCVNAIIQSGIKTLVYCEEYDYNDPNWAKPLTDAGVKVVKLNKSYLKMLNWENIQTEPKFVE